MSTIGPLTERMYTATHLTHSGSLGRTVRTGPAEDMGIPSERYGTEALTRGDIDAAMAWMEYGLDEGRRVFFIFTTWLNELLAYGRGTVADFDVRIADLQRRIGSEPALSLGDDVAQDKAREAVSCARNRDIDGYTRAFRAIRLAQQRVHDNQTDWSWGLLTILMEVVGEERMGEVMRKTMEPWLRERYRALGGMAPREIFELTIEGMRGHHGGPDRSGYVKVTEAPDRWIMEFDPCGTGGRMRRGDPERSQTPRTDPPFSFSVVQGAYDWTWGERGVCLYCSHCAIVNEILPIEQHGTPMRMTEYPRDANDPCRWTVFKDPQRVPEEAFRRVGKQPTTDRPE